MTALPVGEIASGDTNIMKRLKFLQDEIERLRNRPAAVVYSGAAGPAVPQKVPMPAGAAVFFVPFDSKSGDSLYSIANEYLGSASYISLISALNDDVDYSIIAKRRTILMPSRGMVKFLNNQNAFDVQSQLVNAMAVAYNKLGAGRPVDEYYREVGELLYSNDVINRLPSAGPKPIDVNGTLVVITKGTGEGQSWANLKKSMNARNVIVGRIDGRTMQFLIL